ncbi:MAG: cytochrome c3 family protein [Chloroflexi bacterium]|nr:cytochrome c3 family protein [Chloroflexota bacterium]
MLLDARAFRRALYLVAIALPTAIALVVVVWPAIAAVPNPVTPQQPIDFSHVVHAQQYAIPCQFCHRGADQGINAGVPSVEQCMFCHNVAGTSLPEVQKLIRAWQEQQPIDWIRVHRQPDHVHFVHQPHIRAGVTCSTCHGAVESMARVKMAQPLNMAQCLDCHRSQNARTECSVCHY